ncbi:MAG: flagellar hook-basal body complex protein [Hyphomonadaceae bacterium]
MPVSIYASLGRQEGLLREMEVVANNLANSSTVGYKSDRAVFAEFIVSGGRDAPSVSMGGLGGHAFDLTQSNLAFTGSDFDLALQGEGYFLVQTEAGERLTRAGHLQISSEGQLIDSNGNPVLDAGGGTIDIPPTVEHLSIGSDGSISVDGILSGEIGIVLPNGQILRDSNTYFSAPDGFEPAEGATVIQGALEQSNVSPVLEVSRMIEVQRAYEAGQALLEREDQRLSQVISAVRQR